MKASLTLVRLALALTALDLCLIVISGGISVLGPVSGAGFALRLVLALVLVGLDFHLVRKPERAFLHGYLSLLLLLLPLLHYVGYRLRGDGLWYYSCAHSICFDRDLDLTNQYRNLGIDHFRGSQPVRETGLARYTFPAGVGLLWAPFIEAGHAGVWLRNFHGLETAYDGYSDPYLHAVALGNLLIGWAGLLLLDRFLRRWFEPSVSFAATLGTGLGSFLLWYMTYQAIYTHALTFLLVSLLLELWADRPETPRAYATLGLIIGIAASVRWQNSLFGLLPAWTLAQELLRKRWSFTARSGVAFGALFLLGVSPQIICWKVIFDRFWIGVPLGDQYMRWSDPFLSEILFSSRHGLFSWSPLLLIAAVGLIGFVWRRPRVGVPLAGMLLLQTYVNSSVADWWAGGSFGARRFDSVLPILALGLAVAVVWVTGLVRRRPGVVVTALLGAFTIYNVLLMEQVRKRRLPTDDTISWQSAADWMLEDIFDAVGYPFSFPANWAFALRYDRPKTQYDILVGKYLFHSMNNLGGVIDLGMRDPPFIGNGWSTVMDWDSHPLEIRLAIGPRAGIFIPTDRAEPLRIAIECAAPRGTEPQWLSVWLNGNRLGSFRPGTEMKERMFTADERWWSRINLLEFVRGRDAPDEPYLAVDRLRFERLNP